MSEKLWPLFVVLAMFFSTQLLAKEDAARESFDRGREYFEQEKYSAASDHFRRAYALNPSWRILYNIAQSEAAARRYGIAIEMFEKYLAEGGDGIAVERREEVLDEMNSFRGMVGYLQVNNAPDGAIITINGVKRGTTPLSGLIAVSSGVEHTVIIEKGEKILLDTSVRVPSTMTHTLNIRDAEDSSVLGKQRIKDDESKKTTVVDTSLNPGLKLKIAGVTIGGIGAGGLIAALVTGVKGKKIYNDISPACENGCPLEYHSDKETMDNLFLATDVLLISGSVLAATGITLFILGSVKGKKARDTISFSPVIDERFTGGVLLGNF